VPLDVYFDDIDAPLAGPTTIRATSANRCFDVHPAAALKPGAVASEVARAAGIHTATSQLLRWRCDRAPGLLLYSSFSLFNCKTLRR
jgi:hypothetical protein